MRCRFSALVQRELLQIVLVFVRAVSVFFIAYQIPLIQKNASTNGMPLIKQEVLPFAPFKYRRPPLLQTAAARTVRSGVIVYRVFIFHRDGK